MLDKQRTLDDLMHVRLSDLREGLEGAQRDLKRVSPLNLVDRRRQQLDDTTERLQDMLRHMLALRGERLRGVALQLHSLSPLLTIARGYAVVRKEQDQAIVSSPTQVRPGERLTIQVQDGLIPVEVRQ